LLSAQPPSSSSFGMGDSKMSTWLTYARAITSSNPSFEHLGSPNAKACTWCARIVARTRQVRSQAHPSLEIQNKAIHAVEKRAHTPQKANQIGDVHALGSELSPMQPVDHLRVLCGCMVNRTKPGLRDSTLGLRQRTSTYDCHITTSQHPPPRCALSPKQRSDKKTAVALVDCILCRYAKMARDNARVTNLQCPLHPPKMQYLVAHTPGGATTSAQTSERGRGAHREPSDAQAATCWHPHVMFHPSIRMFDKPLAHSARGELEADLEIRLVVACGIIDLAQPVCRHVCMRHGGSPPTSCRGNLTTHKLLGYKKKPNLGINLPGANRTFVLQGVLQSTNISQ